MCGRFDFHGEDIDIAEAFGVPVTSIASRQSYNIAPTDAAPVLWAPSADAWQCTPMRFGWQRRGGGMLVNARADSVLQNAFYRQALQARRCAVVARGFYEWEKVGKKRQPHYVCRKDNALFAFAALWQPASNDAPPTFVIITTEANELIKPLHERMPVVLDPDGVRAWMNADSRDKDFVANVLSPCGEGVLIERAVSTYVNKAGNDGPECIAS